VRFPPVQHVGLPPAPAVAPRARRPPLPSTALSHDTDPSAPALVLCDGYHAPSAGVESALAALGEGFGLGLEPDPATLTGTFKALWTALATAPDPVATSSASAQRGSGGGNSSSSSSSSSSSVVDLTSSSSSSAAVDVSSHVVPAADASRFLAALHEHASQVTPVHLAGPVSTNPSLNPLPSPRLPTPYPLSTPGAGPAPRRGHRGQPPRRACVAALAGSVGRQAPRPPPDRQGTDTVPCQPAAAPLSTHFTPGCLCCGGCVRFEPRCSSTPLAPFPLLLGW